VLQAALPIRVIDGETLDRLMPYGKCIPLVRNALVGISLGHAYLPLRSGMPLPSGAGILGILPGTLAEPPCFGVKLVSMFPANKSRGLPAQMGACVLFDQDSGKPLALLNADRLTAVRTAAASAAATASLMKPGSETLAILGTGEQARAHLESMLAVHEFRRIRIWGRNAAHAKALADWFLVTHNATLGIEVLVDDTVAQAVSDADVVCTLTSAREPILAGRLLKPGTHMNLIGSSFPDAREVDDETVARGRYFVDHRATALAQAGELLSAIRAGRIDKSHIVGEIGAVMSGKLAGRQSAQEVTLYKALESAGLDLAVAWHVWQEAERTGSGTATSL
jgi:ornithine cyclodeaminase